MANSLSLWDIDSGIMELVSAREQVQDDLAYMDANETNPLDYAEKKAELAEVEKCLVEYLQKEIQKVDSIHGFIRYATATAKAAREEAQLFTDKARRLEANVERVKAICMSVMVAMGKKRLEGTAGRTLRIQGNGGKEPLVVDGWDSEKGKWNSNATSALPREFQIATIKMPMSAYLKYCAIEWQAVLVDTEPANARIREELEKTCGECHGKEPERCCNGIDCGCQGKPIEPPCDACNGTGHRIVPGARIAERGAHLRVV